jgi:hypothetical protein
MAGGSRDGIHGGGDGAGRPVEGRGRASGEGCAERPAEGRGRGPVSGMGVAERPGEGCAERPAEGRGRGPVWGRPQGEFPGPRETIKYPARRWIGSWFDVCRRSGTKRAPVEGVQYSDLIFNNLAAYTRKST